jgi:uncharacterized MAPEG superfamily protein
MITRWGFAHQNAIENYPLFQGGVLLALHAKIDVARMNGICALYTIARLAYAAAYISVEDDTAAQIRGILWWIGNGCFLTLMGMAGREMNQ